MKEKRQKLILEYVEKNSVENQDSIINHLKSRGINVTQATVSRDISELGLAKKTGEDGKIYYYAVWDSMILPQELTNIYSNAFISADHAQNIVVVKTRPGMAQAVASAVDSIHLKDSLGTIAGDDTFIIVCRTEQYAANVASVLLKLAR